MFLRLLLILCPVASASTLVGSGGTQLKDLPNPVLASIMVAQDPTHAMQQTSRKFLGDVSRAATGAALARLEDAAWCVRSNAITTLVTISEKDNPKTIEAVSRRLTDDNLSVRVNAVRALVSLTSRARENPGVVAAVSRRLADEDLRVRAEAVRAFVSLNETNQHLVSTISEQLLVSRPPIPYERFFLMRALLSAPGSPIRIDPGPLPSPAEVGEMLAPLWGPLELDSEWSQNTEGSSRMFLTMLNHLFPAQLQGAIEDISQDPGFQTELFDLDVVGEHDRIIQNVDGLITRIEEAEVAFHGAGGAGIGFLLYEPRWWDRTSDFVQIVGKWVHTRRYGVWISIVVFFAGHVEIALGWD